MNASNVDLSTLEGKAVLLHELYHYVQQFGIDNRQYFLTPWDHNNPGWCMARSEAQAFAWEQAYIEANGMHISDIKGSLDLRRFIAHFEDLDDPKCRNFLHDNGTPMTGKSL